MCAMEWLWIQTASDFRGMPWKARIAAALGLVALVERDGLALGPLLPVSASLVLVLVLVLDTPMARHNTKSRYTVYSHE